MAAPLGSTRKPLPLPLFHLTPVAAAASAILLASCSQPGKPETAGPGPAAKPLVFATNYPVTYFAERIAGDHVILRFPAPADEDPAFWKPSAEEIAAFQSAALILLNGATYEKWLDKVSLPSRILVDTSAGLSSAFIRTKEAATHSHGKEGAHSHAGTAFTTWIDFSQAKKQAEAARAALAGLVPSAAETVNRNAEALQADLDQLDADLQAVAQGIGDRPLVASHPVYQYLARRYQLRIEAVLWEPETVPDEAAFGNLKRILATHPAQWMIWEGEPAAETVAMLDSLGVKSVVFDPCGNRPETADWLSVMRQNIENLKAIR